MKLTELDRIYFLRMVVYDNQYRRVIMDTTHLGYILNKNAWVFCSFSKSGEAAVPHCLMKYKSKRPSGRCSMEEVLPTTDFLEGINDDSGEVTCPECLEIAIAGDIPEIIRSAGS